MSQYAYNPLISKKQENPIDHSKFSEWSKNNLYRTSYASHWTNVFLIKIQIKITLKIRNL